MELELFEPMQAQLKFSTGEELTIGGFQAVNRNKVKELGGEKLAELSKVDELELIYLHLQSMHNVKELASHVRLAEGDYALGGGEMDTAEPASAEADDGAPKGATSQPGKKKGNAARSNGRGRKKTGKDA
jgi:hypothetical protein